MSQIPSASIPCRWCSRVWPALRSRSLHERSAHPDEYHTVCVPIYKKGRWDAAERELLAIKEAAIPLETRFINQALAAKVDNRSFDAVKKARQFPGHQARVTELRLLGAAELVPSGKVTEAVPHIRKRDPRKEPSKSSLPGPPVADASLCEQAGEALRRPVGGAVSRITKPGHQVKSKARKSECRGLASRVGLKRIDEVPTPKITVPRNWRLHSSDSEDDVGPSSHIIDPGVYSEVEHVSDFILQF